MRKLGYGTDPSADTKVPPNYDPGCPRLESQQAKDSVSETQTQALEMMTRKRWQEASVSHTVCG